MHDNKKRREITNKHGEKTTKHEENRSQPQLITSKVKAPLKTQQKCKEQHTATNKTTPNTTCRWACMVTTTTVNQNFPIF